MMDIVSVQHGALTIPLDKAVGAKRFFARDPGGIRIEFLSLEKE
jgi:hypothetical protein